VAKKKTLIIVESPAKSNTISRYLGADFLVSSSMGHVRDLPKEKLGIDLKKGYLPQYIDLPEKKATIAELRKLAGKAGRILLASDPDREGEAIAFHLAEILREENPEIQRILFHEITRAAVLEAVEHPLPIDRAKVDSQQMRRLLDRLAGYKISPILQKKIGGPLSAGRVQSIALKLIALREREIQAFQVEEYWTMTARLAGSNPPPFPAKLEKIKGKAIDIKTGEECHDIAAQLKAGEFRLAAITRRQKKRKTPPPLITSTLQQEAFRRFHMPVKRTMQVAQELYEGLSIGGEEPTGLITYMRTDSFRIAEAAQQEARQFIQGRWGAEYIPPAPPTYTSKKKIQDAHEAIRPTLPFHPPEELRSALTPPQLKIYQLIWERFFASQMREADIEETVLSIENGDGLLVARGEVIRFDGFLKVLAPTVAEGEEEEEKPRLPTLTKGETLKLLALDEKQNFTKPPPRYTEDSLVKILEEKGIGRPSTYAKIIDTLGKREYVTREERRFVPTDLGLLVVDYLDENFADLMQITFTAELEKKLDQVSEGKLKWETGIDQFYKKLAKDLERVKGAGKVDILIGKACPQCGGDLVKKYSHKTKGWFVGCSKYPDCRYTEKIGGEKPEEQKDEILDRPCPTCGKPLVRRYSPKTRAHFVGCSGYPECHFIEQGAEELGNCPNCGKPLKKRFSRKTRRFFVGCTGYPECTYIAK